MSTIGWTDRSLNPVLARLPDGTVGYHCEKVSPGCKHCYAESHNRRRLPGGGTGRRFSVQAGSEVEIFLAEEVLDRALRWRPSRMEGGRRRGLRIFYCSMTDLFGGFVPSPMVQGVLDHAVAMAERGAHPQILTKRAGRMVEEVRAWVRRRGTPFPAGVWLGFSAEDQKRFDERWQEASKLNWLGFSAPALYAGPIFCSYEPALGPVDFSAAMGPGVPYSLLPDEGASPPVGTYRSGLQLRRVAGELHWIRACKLGWLIPGGESGAGARHFDIEWARSARDQADRYGVPLYMKQLGSNPNVVSIQSLRSRGKRDGLEELPPDLRVRQFPREAA